MTGRNALLAVAAVLTFTGAAVVTESACAATYVPLKSLGTNTLGSGASAQSAIPDGPIEIFEGPEFDVVNRLIPHSGLSAARVPASHVPTPAGNAVVSTPTGFNGLSHRDQRLAGTGIYTNTQFSLEPPDQALCVGNGFVLESVNTALRVFDATSHAALTGTIALNQFFGLAPEVIRSNPPVFGDFTSDPKCHFDADTGRWFVTLLQADVVPATGAFTGRTHVLIAVSQTGNPAGTWFLYSLDTTNDGTNGTPSHTGCPCLGDQPLIGADANGFYISTNEFPFFAAGFNGAQVYAMSKAGLTAGGALPPVQLINAGTIAAPDGGIWYTLQPATTPPGGSYATASSGTEYFLSALDFSGTLDNRIAVWALTNTISLTTATPNVSLTHAIIDSQVYGQPPDAQQRPGLTPLADLLALHSPKEKLELLAANDDRMNQVVYSNGQLWGAVNTVVKTPNGPTRVGIAYFVVSPAVNGGGQVSGTIAAQGYVAVNQQNVLFPAIGVNNAGKGAMVFTLVGPDVYPSAAYVTIDASNGAGDVHIAGAGAGPEDGFTGYKAFGASGRTARWGDYSAAAVDASGNIWLATEYIPNAPRTVNANWGTFVLSVTP